MCKSKICATVCVMITVCLVIVAIIRNHNKNASSLTEA
jgi:hypothetical protein